MKVSFYSELSCQGKRHVDYRELHIIGNNCWFSSYLHLQNGSKTSTVLLRAHAKEPGGPMAILERNFRLVLRKNATINAVWFKLVWKTCMSNLVISLWYIANAIVQVALHILKTDYFISHNWLKICSWERRTKSTPDMRKATIYIKAFH